MEELKEAIKLIHRATAEFAKIGATLECHIEIVPSRLYQEKTEGQKDRYDSHSDSK